MTLLFTLTKNQITIAWIAYFILCVVLFIIACRWSRKQLKKMHHAHRDNTVTFLVLDDVPGRYVDIQCGQYPSVDMYKSSN